MKLDQHILTQLLNKYGSPLYIFHKSEFVKNYIELLDSVRKIYPKYNIAYSYKTNYTPEICKIVKDLGGFAEVVSEMEYELAKKIGYMNDAIIYNGPVKGSGLFEHLENGGVINVDNTEELAIIVAHANENKEKTYKIAFRVNINVGQNYISRFGIDADGSVLDEAVSQVKSINNIQLVGLHCHIGRSREIQSWEKRVKIMLSLVEKYFDSPPEFINLGSGMYSKMEPTLAEQFGDYIPDYSEYSNVIGKEMIEKFGHLSYEQQPLLITEPGTTVVSSYITFISKVLSIKNIKNKNFAVLDSSYGNIGDICRLKQLPITVFSEGAYHKNVDFVGYTCLEHDVMYRDFCGKLAAGDMIEFRNVGSYSNVFKPPFIAPNCAMIEIDEQQNTKLIKRKETFDDIFQTYQF
ncbi:type III PLP-dependent enzyme domain-containing protein [Ureibacillus acetophenoni]|uniref:Diaminopimelate decarboxylase n=1 Tax=Ureibacillus acetophenoni TaxID=614649 RepID=A0A285U9E6_9BACL|nr:diaminopimelate decarboxylase [Ureibacillus acetophenoni]SOC38439.1 diaminopimelate decarboxylase [Ureibacillus acetophenoni]